MRISRPCFDKPHRCPGWAGGGTQYAKVQRCASGRIGDMFDQRYWYVYVHRCATCGVWVLPYAIRWFSPRWWRWGIWYREIWWHWRRARQRLMMRLGRH